MVEIIAEIAQGYEGDPKLAQLLAKASVKAGAHAVKYQLVYADELATPDYRYYGLFKQLEMSEETWQEIVDYLREANKRVYFDIYGEKGFELARNLKADGIKLSTTEFFNDQLVKKVLAEFPKVFVGIGGIPLEEIERFEYRGGGDAQDVCIITRDKREIIIDKDVRRAFSHLIMKERCRMCCDFSAELADISLGDIYDRKRNRRVPNWNSLIVRTEMGLRLIQDAQKADVIETSPLEEESLYGNRGFESKKHGAVYNLQVRKRYGWPVPDYHYEFTWKAKKRKPYPVPED